MIFECLLILLLFLSLQVTLIATNSPLCSRKHDFLNFISTAEMRERFPPVLLSMPGSGDGWLRLLVEHATGIHTGSMEVHNIDRNQNVFRGEKSCGIRMCAISGHLKDLRVDSVSKLLLPTNNLVQRKCARGEVHSFSTAIVIVRNPLDALWSNYLAVNDNKLTTFNKTHWEQYLDAATISWSTNFGTIFRPMFSSFDKKDILVVRYEDLQPQSPNSIQSIASITNFMNYSVSEEKLQCAFPLSEAKISLIDRSRNASDTIIRKSEAYRSLGQDHYCKYMTRINAYSKFFNYQIMNENEDNSSPIPFHCAPGSPSSLPELAQCEAYKNPDFRTEKEIIGAPPPPVLLTLPGSGNSMSRVMIEYATGILTGSLEMNDVEYKGIFRGERACGLRMSVIKGHPKDLRFDPKSTNIVFTNKPTRKKCARGSIHHFSRIIAVMRNPYDALWANYQLQTTHQHTGYLTKSDFNVSHFAEFALDSARGWHDCFRNLYLPVFQLPAERRVIIRYEDILDVNLRMDMLRKMVEIISPITSEERLACTFTLINSQPKVKRPRGPDYISSAIAYNELQKPDFDAIKNYFSEIMAYFNYTVPVQK